MHFHIFKALQGLAELLASLTTYICSPDDESFAYSNVLQSVTFSMLLHSICSTRGPMLQLFTFSPAIISLVSLEFRMGVNM